MDGRLTMYNVHVHCTVYINKKLLYNIVNTQWINFHTTVVLK